MPKPHSVSCRNLSLASRLCHANLVQFLNLDSIVTQDEKYFFHLNFAKQRVWRFKKVLLSYNAGAHRAKVTTEKLAQLRYVRMPHPPYSPDISPCDYHYFSNL
ncbi:unnamed protein product [Heligmosomoides polygyrus]|uniref:Mariner Mos1 transposase n=1 Tax=Heligmosomoides polygyrus TaxID=6339 RepID=A0A183GQJ6_HELPZ|nr:unnamed protein product [Heligmosomoides polygyrus]